MSLVPQCTLEVPSVTFHSNSTSNYQLSNLYGCSVELMGTFPSAEHAYQYLQKVDGSHEDWCVGGKFADWDYVLGIVNEHKSIRKEFWKKKNMIGILAKLVISHPKTFGVKLKPMDGMDTSKQRWFPIFAAKFQGDLKSMLLKTSGMLVEHDRKAKVRVGKWGGLVQNGVLYGPNIMGKLLTMFRDSMRPKRVPKRVPKRDIEEVAHSSVEEVVAKKFKKARLEGKVVDLTSGPSGPLFGKVENLVVTFAGQIESDHTGATHGTKRKGFSRDDVVSIGEYLGNSTMYTIPGIPRGHVVVARGVVKGNDIFEELTSIEEAYVDKHMWMYGKCREKKSRVNSNYADIAQKGQMNHPDPKQRVPSLLPFGPHLARVRDLLTEMGKALELDTQNLYGEVNHYLKDTKTIQGIGEHLDKERSMVAGLCLGTTDRNICFQAYSGAVPIGPKLKLVLRPGDMYFMDMDAKGIPGKHHIKHHATGGRGSDTYLRRVTLGRRRKLLKREGLNKYAQAIVDGNELFTDGTPMEL